MTVPVSVYLLSVWVLHVRYKAPGLRARRCGADRDRGDPRLEHSDRVGVDHRLRDGAAHRGVDVEPYACRDGRCRVAQRRRLAIRLMVVATMMAPNNHDNNACTQDHLPHRLGGDVGIRHLKCHADGERDVREVLVVGDELAGAVRLSGEVDASRVVRVRVVEVGVAQREHGVHDGPREEHDPRTSALARVAESRARVAHRGCVSAFARVSGGSHEPTRYASADATTTPIKKVTTTHPLRRVTRHFHGGAGGTGAGRRGDSPVEMRPASTVMMISKRQPS